MRKILSLFAVLALAACGGGGGGGTTANPPAPPTVAPTTAPQGGLVTPQFTLQIPARASSAKGRTPQYVSSATLSVVITLTADSVGINPTTITGNPATTTVAAGSCSAGCTVNGPPTPPGTDSFRVVTYDNAVPANGNAINAAQLNNVTVTAGQTNAQNITLLAIPKTLTISALPTTWNAGTQTQQIALMVAAKDGHGDSIPTGLASTPKYGDALGNPISITVSDPDTTLHGTCINGASTCTTGVATSGLFIGPDDQRIFYYDGLAENPVTLTATATGAASATASFQPILSPPVFNSSQATPSGVALTASPEIDLFAPSGIGSTGSESFTELGWTGAPYNQALTFANTGACTVGAGLATSMTQIATIAAGANSTTTGTPFTATVAGGPVAGSCPSKISDGLTSNTTDGSATLTVTYTTSTVHSSSKNRR
jgi:hypothetical protein